MNHLGVVLLFAVVSFTSSQLTFRSQPLKKLTSTFDQPRSNLNRGPNRYQYNAYNDNNDYYSSRYRGQYSSQGDGQYSGNRRSSSGDNSGQYIPDDSGRYVHVDYKYNHLDIAGEGYKHKDGDIEKYRPDYSSDGYNGDFEKYKGDGGYKGSPDNYDVGGYKGDNEKYKEDGGYKGYNDKFDVDGYKGDKDKQIPYKDNNNSGAGALSKNKNQPNSGAGALSKNNNQASFGAGALSKNNNQANSGAGALSKNNNQANSGAGTLSKNNKQPNSGAGALSKNNNQPNYGNNNQASRPNRGDSNSLIDRRGGQGSGSSNSNKFVGIDGSRKTSGIGDEGVLNNKGNPDSKRYPNAKYGSDICDYNSPKNFKIIRQKSDLGIDRYHYLYETENCMYKEEEGAHVQVNNEETLRAEGIYYYVAPDNVKYTTTYTADERGFLPSGDHIPAIPPLILKGLQYLKSIGKL